MILLFDIGNTHTHLGLASEERVVKRADIPTKAWQEGNASAMVRRFIVGKNIKAAALCSVVPRVTPLVVKTVRALAEIPVLQLTHKTVRGVGIDFPRPASIGPDRLANAVAARHRFGSPVVVVGFGTAVAFDVVNADGNYIGGIIAPGLAAMTDYLHEKTALLPRIRICEIETVIGKSTRQAMLIGAVHGYRGLVRELIAKLKKELGAKKLPVVATGGYAALIAAKLPEISAVAPDLTLEGVRLTWLRRASAGNRGSL